MRPSREHVVVAVGIAVIGLAGVAGAAGSTGVAIAVAIAVAVTASVAVFLDQFTGFIAGLAASAALILGRRVLGPWGEDEFWLALTQTVGLVAAGTAAGTVGRSLRRRPDAAPSGNGPPEPVFGSLGLLDADIAMERLAEEVERATRHRRPLTVLVLDVEPLIEISGDVLRSAHRALSRIFESRLPDTDVPFALSDERLGAILPESTPADAWERVGLVFDAVTEARFNVRSEATERSLGDTIRLHVGMAELGHAVMDADALLDAATAALPSRTRPDGAG